MKRALAILRGFPGLGRVVAGIEILKTIEDCHNYTFKVVTYLQGELYCKSLNIQSEISIYNEDICSIGIIPVSISGERIFGLIDAWQPDLIICDGEPLLNELIKDVYPQTKLMVILNPFDVQNPFNTTSSSFFFNKCYGKSDIAIVHGLQKVNAISNYRHFFSINTILRRNIIRLKPNLKTKRIVCILGGGSTNTNNHFINNTVEIGLKSIYLAQYLPQFGFDIYCGSSQIAENLIDKSIIPINSNINIHIQIGSERELYENTSLVIARGGRNTISELLFLGIPSILFSTQNNHRGKEQESNISFAVDFSNHLLKTLPVECENNQLIDLVKNSIDLNKSNYRWESGNFQLKCILNDSLI